jgi:hypothetical protein
VSPASKPAVPVWSVYRLRNAAGVVIKAGIVTRNAASVHRDHRRYDWYPEVDESRTTLTAYPDKERAEAALQRIRDTRCPRYNRQHRPESLPRIAPLAMATPTTDEPEDTSTPQTRQQLRVDEDQRIAMTAPRQPDQLCVGDTVWCIPLGAEALITDSNADRTVFEFTSRDGRVHAPGDATEAIAPRPAGLRWPTAKVLDRLRTEWLRDNAVWPDIDPYPRRREQA